MKSPPKKTKQTKKPARVHLTTPEITYVATLFAKNVPPEALIRKLMVRDSGFDSLGWVETAENHLVVGYFSGDSD